MLAIVDSTELAIQDATIFVANDVIWSQKRLTIRHLGFHHFFKNVKKQWELTSNQARMLMKCANL